MINQYRGYALNPAKVPGREDGGRAGLPRLPHLARLPGAAAQLPDERAAGLLPGGVPGGDARAPPVPRTVSARRPLVVRGTIASACRRAARSTARASGSRASPRADGPDARARPPTDDEGAFRLRWRPDRSGRLFLTTPRFRDLSPLRRSLGRVRVRAAVGCARRACRGGAVVLAAAPGRDGAAPRAARRAGATGRGRRVPGGPAGATARAAGTASGSASTCPRARWRRAGPLRRPRHRGGRTIQGPLRRRRLIVAAACVAAPSSRRRRAPRASS